MDLNPRLLAFLKYELKQIQDDRDRAGEDRKMASTLVGRIEAEIEKQENTHLNGVRA